MSAAMSLLSEDDFLCSICLDLFTDPVSTPCGHNFCKKCISELKKKECRCPVCRQAFNQKGKFKVNSFIAQMVALLRLSSKQEARGSRSEIRVANPGDVPCDICTGTKLKAQKSCLLCLVSYCESHLKPHLRVPGLIKHQLIDPVWNLEDKMCKKHEKPLELFCVTDETCVCVDCPLFEHKSHEITLLTAHEEKKLELKKMEAEIQRRQLKIQDLKHSMEFSKVDVDREIVKGVQVFTSVKESVQKEEAAYVRTIEDKQRSLERRAQTYIDELEQEISELMERKSKLEKLSLSGDHVNLQETVQAVNIEHPIPTKDWEEVSIHPFLWERIAVKALLHLEETVSKKKVTLAEAELMVVQRYAVDVTLNPRTAHRKLILSEDGKQVYHGNVWQKIPDYPERFSKSVSVLGKQSLSSGRFYFDIQVKGKTEWVLGVVRESIKRKGSITLCPKNGSWTILLRNGNLYKAHTGPAACLPVKVVPEKVGVFVDYEEGLVSFFDVYTETLISSFNGCSFTEKLFPFFSPCLNMVGKNTAPMIICPVAQTE